MGQRLEIPVLLQELITGGRWPRNANEAMRQNLHSIVAAERIHQIAACERSIYLYAPPFSRVDEHAHSGHFWQEFGALDQIAPELSLVVGDFGIGSDAPIILDYREPVNPPVFHLHWSGAGTGKTSTSWVRCADSFEDFAKLLGL